MNYGVVIFVLVEFLCSDFYLRGYFCLVVFFFFYTFSKATCVMLESHTGPSAFRTGERCIGRLSRFAWTEPAFAYCHRVLSEWPARHSKGEN